MDSVPSDHVPHAIFEVKRVECVPRQRLTRITLRAPSEPTYPLRVGQYVQLNKWPYALRIRAVGEGSIDLWDSDVANVTNLGYPAPLWGVNVTHIIRIAEGPPSCYTLVL